MGAVLASIVAALIGSLVLRLRSHFLAVTTLGLVMMLYVFNINAETLTGGALGIKGVPLRTETWHLLLGVAVLAWLFHRLAASHIGRAWQSIRLDEDAAGSLGINVYRYRMLAFVLSAPIAAAAGALDAHLIGFIDPNAYTFSLTLIFSPMACSGHRLLGRADARGRTADGPA